MTVDELEVVPAGDDQDLRAAHALLLLCGEHMHRAQGMDHWWPWPPFERFRARLEGRDVVFGLLDGAVVATWNTSTLPEAYHDLSLWPEPDAPALFLSGVGVLPAMWGRGIGAALIAHVEATARDQGLDRIRLDAVASNPRLVSWYGVHGYAPVGDLQVTEEVSVTCMEKYLDVPGRPAHQ